ncbi:MAG: hypothetical protein Q7J47_03210 [Azoarcus sp.]|nr:hypothetical protein [Azoarcus sp.]
MAAPMEHDDVPDHERDHDARVWFWRLYAAAWVLGLMALAGVFS